MLCPLTDNTQIRSNYSSVIKSIETFEDNPYKFVMHAHKMHVSNKFIFSELYMQQKSVWDKEGTLDQLTFEDIHNPDWEPSTKIDDWFLKFNRPEYGYKADNLVGLGPYQVTEFETGQYITIERKNN